MFNLFQLNIYDCVSHKIVKQIFGFYDIHYLKYSTDTASKYSSNNKEI